MSKNVNRDDFKFDFFNKLVDIFVSKNWSVTENDFYCDSLFNSFCNMLNFFKKEQQDLLLELTKEFLFLSTAQYINQLKIVLTKIQLSKPIVATKIYVLPMKNPETDTGTKSSDLITSLYRDPDIRYHSLFRNKEICVNFHPNALPNNFNAMENAMLVLTDDFIGTGETAEGTLDYYINIRNIDTQKIAIIVLVAQEDGIRSVKRRGIEVYAALERAKGITNRYVSPDRDRNLQLMFEMEEIIGVNRKYSLGYGKSEALVALQKTPNNTFPVYWLKTKVKKELYAPPFERR
jgi:hypothetical protein